MLHYVVEDAFEDLLAAWRTWQSLSTQPNVPLTRRAEARTVLDKARNRMHRLRTAIHPEADERGQAVERVWCEALETVVYLGWTNRSRRYPGNFECPCGELVPIDWDSAPPG